MEKACPAPNDSEEDIDTQKKSSATYPHPSGQNPMWCRVKISLFSKIMAGIAIVFAILLLWYIIQERGKLIYFFEWSAPIACLIIILIGLLVISTYLPILTALKILIIALCVFPFGLVIVIVYAASVTAFNDFLGIIGLIVFLTALLVCFPVYWTVSIVVIKILKIKRESWFMWSLSLLAIIAIIAPMTYSKNERCPMNETKAKVDMGFLKTTQATWKQMDYDNNGINDYWTYDISCFYRMKDRAGNSIMTIDRQFAKSDTAPAKNDVFGTGYIQESLVSTPVSSAGYYFRAMLFDENGIPYNQNEVGATKVKATNSTKWAFVAYPSAYGTSGRRTFIINEEGITYSADCGSFEKGIILQWPGSDPIKVKGPGGQYWAKAE